MFHFASFQFIDFNYLILHHSFSGKLWRLEINAFLFCSMHSVPLCVREIKRSVEWWKRIEWLLSNNKINAQVHTSLINNEYALAPSLTHRFISLNLRCFYYFLLPWWCWWLHQFIYYGFSSLCECMCAVFEILN